MGIFTVLVMHCNLTGSAQLVVYLSARSVSLYRPMACVDISNEEDLVRCPGMAFLFNH